MHLRMWLAIVGSVIAAITRIEWPQPRLQILVSASSPSASVEEQKDFVIARHSLVGRTGLFGSCDTSDITKDNLRGFLPLSGQCCAVAYFKKVDQNAR